jgi:hypothetical protein
MELTISTFFSQLIFDPCKADTQKSRIVSLVASIALLIFTVGIVHAICAMRRVCQKSKEQMNQTDKKTQELAKEQLKIESKKDVVETQEETKEEVNVEEPAEGKGEVQFAETVKESRPAKNALLAKRRSTGRFPSNILDPKKDILVPQNDVRGMPKSAKDSGTPAEFQRAALNMRAPSVVKEQVPAQNPNGMPGKLPPKPKKA